MVRTTQRFASCLLVVAFCCSGALGAAKDDDDHEYRAPGPNDKRSPCPAINVLANHGYINRNGQEIDIQELAEALALVFPVTKEFPFLPLQGAKKAGLVDNDTLTLDRLSEHKKQEHDASFTRVDSYFVTNNADYLVNKELLAPLWEANGDTPFLDRHAIKEFQAARVRDSLHHNPEASFSDSNIKAMAQQAARVLAFGQDHQYGYVDKAIVKSILQDERLPKGYALDPKFEKLSFQKNSLSLALSEEYQASIRKTIAEYEASKDNDICHGLQGTLALFCRMKQRFRSKHKPKH